MKSPKTISFELRNDNAARECAREIAEKSGKEVVVTDDVGRELFRVRPTSAARPNQLAIRYES